MWNNVILCIFSFWLLLFFYYIVIFFFFWVILLEVVYFIFLFFNYLCYFYCWFKILVDLFVDFFLFFFLGKLKFVNSLLYGLFDVLYVWLNIFGRFCGWGGGYCWKFCELFIWLYKVNKENCYVKWKVYIYVSYLRDDWSFNFFFF